MQIPPESPCIYEEWLICKDGQFVLIYVTKILIGSGSIVQLILNTCSTDTAVGLLLLKESQYPMNRRMYGPQCQLGYSGEDKNLLPLPYIKTWIVQPLAQ
jgi:hypothetical protein